MRDVLVFFEENGIDRRFESLGYDFHKLFPERERSRIQSAYGDYQWLVKTVGRFGTIINAVPPDDKIDVLPWEEWFVLEGKLTHHVLYLAEPDSFDEIFDAPAHDDVHPRRTLGKTWYVIDDEDMSPVLLRK
jgi:hypothetical protein